MAAKEIVDAILRLIEILTACTWPLIIFLILFLFRQQIRDFLPGLGQRLKKAEIVGTKFEFSEVAVNALQDAIETGAEEYKNEPEKLVGFVREQVNKLPAIRAVPPPASELTLSRRSILWVDDKPMNNVYESSILKRLGASIVFARSTGEALAFLERDSHDLIISDIHRVEDGRSNPDAGYELLEALTRPNMNIPLIFYTGSIARMDRNRASSAYGAADIPSRLIDLAIRALEAR